MQPLPAPLHTRRSSQVAGEQAPCPTGAPTRRRTLSTRRSPGTEPSEGALGSGPSAHRIMPGRGRPAYAEVMACSCMSVTSEREVQPLRSASSTLDRCSLISTSTLCVGCSAARLRRSVDHQAGRSLARTGDGGGARLAADSDVIVPRFPDPGWLHRQLAGATGPQQQHHGDCAVDRRAGQSPRFADRRAAPSTQAHHDAATLVDRSDHADPVGQMYDAFVRVLDRDLLLEGSKSFPATSTRPSHASRRRSISAPRNPHRPWCITHTLRPKPSTR